MSLFPQPAICGASDQGGYFLDRSLRFRESASAYLTRTPSSAGNRKTFTISYWHKKAKNAGFLFEARNSSGGSFFALKTTGDTLNINDSQNSDALNLTTTQVFRDVSSWYHIVVAIDTTQATSSNRAKLYVNGEQVTSFSTSSYPAQNADMMVNSTIGHYIGCGVNASGTPTLFIDAYLTEINFIDGQALDPTSFGEFDADTGVWKPLSYSGSYGTNGFYLNFNDPTSTATISQDQSGNGNDWTSNNISLTSGSTYDSMTDVPTLTGINTANYCTLNALTLNAGGGATTPSGSSSDGNLKWIGTGGNDNVFGTMAASSGKWYYEIEIVANPNTLVAGWSTTDELADYTQSALVYYNSAGIRNGNRTVVWDTNVTTGLTFSVSDVIGFALDIDSGDLKVYQNNSLVSTITLPTDKGDKWIPAFGDSSQTDASFTVNFGQRPFTYTSPTGFKSLNTYNLPDSTVDNGSEYFNTVLYTGNGTSQSITGVNFQPDFVWVKRRSAAASHILEDAVRGATQRLISNLSDAESTDSGSITSFDSDGFSVGSTAAVNSSAGTFVGWNWKANGSGVSNTVGSIPSTVSANTTSGFSIVSYTGTGSASTVGHGLGVAPSMIIFKNRDGAYDWATYHKDLTSAAYTVYLSLNYAQSTNSTVANYYNSTAPTSSVFSIGASNNYTNLSSNKYIAYCFADIEGFSSFGSYTGNGSADGPFIYTGFRPAWIMVKRYTAVGNWQMFDSARDLYNPEDGRLYANLTDAENDQASVDFVSNGFKMRDTSGDNNSSGESYLYMAFAENPFKNSLAR